MACYYASSSSSSLFSPYGSMRALGFSRGPYIYIRGALFVVSLLFLSTPFSSPPPWCVVSAAAPMKKKEEKKKKKKESRRIPKGLIDERQLRKKRSIDLMILRRRFLALVVVVL